MSKTYRVAFAGAGGIVQAAHIPNFQSLSNVETVALADVNEARAKSVAAEKKIKSAYTDFNTMLEKEQQHAKGYAQHPVAPGEFDVWEAEQSWGEG